MTTAKCITTKNKNGDEVDVCIRLERDEDGKDFVKISTWHEDGVGNWLYQETQVDFNAANQTEMYSQFIEDFSNEAAYKFANSFDF